MVALLEVVLGVDDQDRSQSRGEPTYLNFDKPYPDHDFTVIIWGRDRDSFPAPPEDLEGHTACAFGEVERYRGKAQMTLRRPEQLNTRPPEPQE